MKKFVKELTPIVMAITFLTLYIAVYRHVIIFHEQHHLFLFSADYTAQTLHDRGLWWWLAEFVVQFGYIPWLGACVWTVLLMGTYCMVRGIIRRLTGLRDWLQLSAILPVVMFFNSVNVDALPETAVKIFVIVAGVWIISLIAGRFIPRFIKQNNDSKFAKAITLCGPLLFAVIYFIGYSDFYKPRTITVSEGKTREMSREDVHLQRHIEGLMIRADQAIRCGDWDEVLEISDEVSTYGRKNHLMDYFRSMALYNKGMLIDHLFDKPQKFGVRVLYYPWKADRNQAEYGGYVYERLGALNTAIHWEFEALVGWGETAQHLIRLSKYYIKTGKPEQAKKFIAPLRKSLFYRGTAKELDEMLANGDVPDLHDALTTAPTEPGRWDCVSDISEDLVYMLYFDHDNKMVQEYLLMATLLKNEMNKFYQVVKAVYAPGTELPKTIQQALCLVRLKYGAERLAADGYKISPEVDAEFRDYLSRHAKGKQARFSPSQKQTVWYYIHFISPEGKQLIF